MIPANDILRENPPRITKINHLDYAYTIFNQKITGCISFDPPDYISQRIEVYDLPAGVNEPSEEYLIHEEMHSIYYKQISITPETEEHPAYQLKIKMGNYFYRFKYRNAYYYATPSEGNVSDFVGPFYSLTQTIDIDNRKPWIYSGAITKFLYGSWVDFFKKYKTLNIYLDVKRIPNPKVYDIFSWKGVFNEVKKLRRRPNPVTGSYVVVGPVEPHLREFFINFINNENLPYAVWSFFKGDQTNIYPDSKIPFLFEYNREKYSINLKGNLLELFQKYQEEL